MDIQSLIEAINLILSTFSEPFSWAVILGVSFTIAISYGGGWTFKTTLLVRDLGLPVGLIFSMLGTASILDQSHNLVDLSSLYTATAIMLMTITYGGLLAIVAHFILLSGKAESSSLEAAHGPTKEMTGFVVVFTTILISFGIYDTALQIISVTPVLLHLITLITAISLSKSQTRLKALFDAALYGSLLCILVGLISLFRGNSQMGLMTAALGLIYGLLIHLSCFIAACHKERTSEYNFALINWHWIETTAFFIFMFLAPQTIIDAVDQAEMMRVINELKGEVEILQNQTAR